nr:hypothetical protein CFP56_25438 [Quercus suber]
MSLFKLLTATGMELGIGGCFSLMLGKLSRGTGMKRTSIFSLLQDGRYMTQRENGSVIPSMGIDYLSKTLPDQELYDMFREQ